MRKDRLVIKGKPKGTAKDEIVLQHLINKQEGIPIPYFIDEKDGRLKYLDKKTTDKKTGVITYGYNDLTKKLEREARYAAEKLRLTPDLKLFQKVFGKVKGQQIFLDEVAKSDAIFNANDPDLYDIDHMGSKKFKYPHMARNFNPQLSAANRSEGARLLTKQQETALRILRDDLETSIQLQGPELTQAQKDIVMERSRGGVTKNLIKSSNGENGENGYNGKNGRKNGKVNGGVLGATGKARKVDALANIGMNAATGNYAGVAVGGGALAMTAALQNRQTQKALGKQIGKLVSKRAGRTMMKAVPGLDIFLSGQESLAYLKQGKLDQAGIAALSGAVGWIPIIGDGLSASFDLTNTGIDISRLHLTTKTSKKKGVIRPKSPTRRLKFGT